MFVLKTCPCQRYEIAETWWPENVIRNKPRGVTAAALRYSNGTPSFILYACDFNKDLSAAILQAARDFHISELQKKSGEPRSRQQPNPKRCQSS